MLIDSNLATQTDTSSIAIGRRYARMDEIGVPFTITVDQDTLQGKGPTVRERDSGEQCRVPEEDLVGILSSLSHAVMKWEEVVEKFGRIDTKAS